MKTLEETLKQHGVIEYDARTNAAVNEYADQFKPKWIPVSESRPDESREVLGCMKDTLDVYVCFYRKSRNLFEVYGLGRKQPITDMKVTHWMEKPTPPAP